MKTDLLLLVALALGLSAFGGCAKDPKALEREQAERASRQWVLLTESKWDEKIIRSLTNAGFDVRPKGDADPAARYGLSVAFGRQIDYCVVNDSLKLAAVTYEVTVPETKQIVASAKAAGWTGSCIVQWPTVFEELADVMQTTWAKRKAQ
jgi:hypothetical protein